MALVTLRVPEVHMFGSVYTSGTGHVIPVTHCLEPTFKQKTLDVGNSMSLAQADGEYSHGCTVNLGYIFL